MLLAVLNDNSVVMKLVVVIYCNKIIICCTVSRMCCSKSEMAMWLTYIGVVVLGVIYVCQAATGYGVCADGDRVCAAAAHDHYVVP